MKPFKDNPNEDKPEYLTSWRNVRLSKKEISEWPECISSIIDLGKILEFFNCIKISNFDSKKQFLNQLTVKDRDFTDSCFDYENKNDLFIVISHLAEKRLVCPSIFKNEPHATEMVDSSELKIEDLIEELKNRNSVGFTWIDMFKFRLVHFSANSSKLHSN